MVDGEGTPRESSSAPSVGPRRISFMEVLLREKRRQRLRAQWANTPGRRGPDPEDRSGEGPGSMSEEARSVIAGQEVSAPGSEAERRALALEVIVELETELARIQRAIVRLEEEMVGGDGLPEPTAGGRWPRTPGARPSE